MDNVSCFLMSWRVIHISNESRLSLKQNNLSLLQGNNVVSVPLEDIGVLIMESRAVLVTTALLDACIQHKISVFVCDEKHMPSGVLLGYQQHSRQVAVIEKQLNWSLPFRKRLWQLIVEQKISNQSVVFIKVSGRKNNNIESYVRSVQSGDVTNREGVAAREYFQNILSTPILRSEDTHINAALNYGYAIVRGVLSRTLASYGFLTSVGIHHNSELNNFNLADDLIESYRPIVDLFVFKNITNDKELLTKEERIELIQLLTKSVQINGEQHTLLHAIESTVKSLVTVSEIKEIDSLCLPTL